MCWALNASLLCVCVCGGGVNSIQRYIIKYGNLIQGWHVYGSSRGCIMYTDVKNIVAIDVKILLSTSSFII